MKSAATIQFVAHIECRDDFQIQADDLWTEKIPKVSTADMRILYLLKDRWK